MSTICIASAQTVSDYLRSLRARRLSPKTINTAKSVLHNLALATGASDLLALGHAELFEWQCRRAERVAARTLRKDVSYVRQFYRWAVDEGLLGADPSGRLPTPKVPRLLPKPISEEELAQALEAADEWMQAILCLAAFAGLRAAEIASLSWSDVFLNQAEPTVRVVGKGSKEGVIDLSPVVVQVLRRLPTRRGPVVRRLDGQSGHNTPNRISQVVCRFLRSCGIEASLHWLRHRAITTVCRLGGLHAAQKFARHASPSTTDGYAKITNRELRPVVVAAGEIQAC